MRWFSKVHQRSTVYVSDDMLPTPTSSVWIHPHLPFQTPILYTKDSYIPNGDMLPSSLPRSWLEGYVDSYEGVLRFNGGSRARLPYTAQELDGRLPPYVKLHTSEVNGCKVHIVNPSSRILDRYSPGRFLFRGESSLTPDEDAELIIHHLSEGNLRPKRSVHDAQYVYATPHLSTSLGYGRDGSSGHAWVIDRSAMDSHLISVYNGGAEVWFPEISIKHLTACITTPDIRARVEDEIGKDLPIRLVEIKSDDSLQHVEQIVRSL